MKKNNFLSFHAHCETSFAYRFRLEFHIVQKNAEVAVYDYARSSETMEM